MWITFAEFLKVLSVSLIIVVCSSLTLPSRTLAQVDNNDLAQVKRIFVESYPTTNRESQIEPIARQLRNSGFEVVNEPLEADAVLSWASQVEIVLHGDGSVPDKSIFSWQLVLSDKRVIWKHAIKFVSKKSPRDDLEYAVQKMVKKLLEDQKKALKKTRINSHDVQQALAADGAIAWFSSNLFRSA